MDVSRARFTAQDETGTLYRAAAAVGGAICNLADCLEPRLSSVQLLPGERHTARHSLS